MRAGYSRVSFRGQDHQVQLEAMTIAGCSEIRVEATNSPNIADRPILTEVLNGLSEGDTLVVWRLDCLARNLRQLIETAIDLRSRKIDLLSLSEQIDTSTPQGRLFFDFVGVVSQFQRHLIEARAKAGLEAAHAKGRRSGRKRALSNRDIETARELLASGSMKQAEVARVMQVSPATLSRALRQVAGSTYAK